MATIKASTLKNRKADTENAMDKVNACILSGNLTVEVQYEMKDGYKVRIPNRENPVNREDMLELLNGNRAITKEDILEQVGANVMAWMLKKGIIRDNGNTIYYVTMTAKKYYDLRKPAVGNYFK